VCVPRSNLPLRNRVHDELTALLSPGGPLGVAPAHLREFLDDDMLIAEIARDYRAAGSGGALDGHAIVVTAGPPGAGKSSAVTSLAAGHRRIDSDEIKDMLLARADSVGLLDIRSGHILADGGPVRPGELAGWVHHTSTDIADLVRVESLRIGENIVVEGTLGWHGLISQYPTELAEYDYAQLTVLDVEVPRAIAIEQARNRWWIGRRRTSVIGGRFVPDIAFDAFYPTTDAVSVCATRARELYTAALDAGVDSQLAFVGRDASGQAVRPAVVRRRRGCSAFGADARCHRPSQWPEGWVAAAFAPESGAHIRVVRSAVLHSAR
jgi:dephospho-CoA kinase